MVVLQNGCHEVLAKPSQNVQRFQAKHPTIEVDVPKWVLPPNTEMIPRMFTRGGGKTGWALGFGEEINGCQESHWLTPHQGSLFIVLKSFKDLPLIAFNQRSQHIQPNQTEAVGFATDSSGSIKRNVFGSTRVFF